LNAALALKPLWTEARLRRLNLRAQLGLDQAAAEDLHWLWELGHPAVPAMQNMLRKLQATANRARNAVLGADLQLAEDRLRELLVLSPYCTACYFSLARVAQRLGDLPGVVIITQELIRLNKTHFAARVLRARALYDLGEGAAAISYVRSALRLAPDDSNARELFRLLKSSHRALTEGEAAVEASRYDQAKFLALSVLPPVPRSFRFSVDTPTPPAETPALAPAPSTATSTVWDMADETYVASLEMSKFHKFRLLVLLCKTLCLTEELEAAMDACDAAHELEPHHWSPFLWRAEIYMLFGNFNAAVADLREGLKYSPQQEQLNNALLRAESSLSFSSLPNLYELLELEVTASEDQIRRAFRKLALQYHPDKYHGDNLTRDEVEQRYTDLTKAYKTLLDPEKRQRYDAGKMPKEAETSFTAEERAMQDKAQRDAWAHVYNTIGREQELRARGLPISPGWYGD
jgi:tetratricopeptide (TPR) repeat protein